MRTQQLNAQQLRHRKFLLVLPLLILPFLTMAFKAMDGGKGDPKTAVVQSKGLNTTLPGAEIAEEKNADKMSIYDQAVKDSLRNDDNNFSGLHFSTENPADKQEQQISERLSRISEELNKPQSYGSPADPHKYSAYKDSGSAEVERLEKLIKTMGSGKEADPEMEQLAGVLQKIQEIQNPKLVKNKVASVPAKPDSTYHAIPAAIEGDQKVVQGAVVKIRLLDSMSLKGQQIPKGLLLFGTCQITNQRLMLNIKNIRLGTSIVPVDLSVYDQRDAMEGIDAPDAELLEAAGGGASDALQSIQLLSMDQSIGTQAAGAGIQAAKGLFSKKVKRIKVKLHAGYPVLLRNNRPNQ
ncbi:Bacteroides conjugative transposon TraM protein [Mucilaginibacter pineti]|uniref:Bacteroides conjugative transposon TraM protein n=1 Tax=Mucilaginibacter pineti TaxID=1391627 RepID=A0A1G7EPR5_9SPHI|nr:conjugative transposon protein TraM [Mucilaginibacter pineti]SDE65619.1 Bacteroides conjugative transposon TraM protein [Mucilaginibacter pineti]